MSAESQTFEHLEPIPARYGHYVILFSICFFEVLNRVVAYLGPPKSTLATKPWKWKNIFISWLHAVIVGVWDLACFYLYPEMLQDLIAHQNPCTYAMVAFSTGYFIYDFVDVYREGRMRSSWEVVVHHIFVVGMFYYDVVTCRCIAYNVVAILAEVNSAFLHARKLMQLCQFEFDHWLYRLNVYLNLLSFILCRFCSVGVIIHGMIFWRHRVDFTYFCCLTSAIFVMASINTILFWRLVKNDIIRYFFSKRHSKIRSVKGKYNANNNVKENVVMENGSSKKQE